MNESIESFDYYKKSEGLNINPYLESIRTNGFAVIPAAFSNELADELKCRIEKLEKDLPPVSPETIPRLNKSHKVVYSLENKDAFFLHAMIKHPITKAIKTALLNDQWYTQIPQENPNYILRSMLARSGGNTDLPLHIDSFIPTGGKYTFVMQASFILEDQTLENGCTYVVPGSHLIDRYCTQDDRQDAIPVESRKGDIVIWDSRLWHGAFGNKSESTRWAFIGTFTRWWIKQNYDTVRNISDEIFAQLDEEEKSILGFCCYPPFNEYERIDIKGGYELVMDGKRGGYGNN